MRNVAFRFRLYPDGEQRSLLARTVGCTRFVGNKAKALFKDKQFASYADLCGMLGGWKDEHPWLREVPHHCLQQSLKDARNALDKFFKGEARFPQFHRKGEKDSARFPDPAQFHVGKGAVTLPKLGVVPWVAHRELVGTPKSITVVLDGGHWYASVLCEIDGEHPLPKPADHEQADLGLTVRAADLGVAHPIVTSDGKFLPYPRRTDRREERERRLQRSLARKKKGSANRRKALRRLNACRAKERRRRLDAARKAVVALFAGADVVALEDLRVKAMTASAKGTQEEPGKNVAQKAGLNRAILEVGWGQIRSLARWYAEREGKRLVLLNPAYSSQECARCGHVAAENRKSQAVFRCVACGHRAHADVNAAEVLEKRAVADLKALVEGYDIRLAEQALARRKAYARRQKAADGRRRKLAERSAGGCLVPACGAAGRTKKQELPKAAPSAKGSPAL